MTEEVKPSIIYDLEATFKNNLFCTHMHANPPV